MLKILESLKSVKEADIVWLFDTKKVTFPDAIQIDEKIQAKVKKSLQTGKSFHHNFFIGEKNCEHLQVLYFNAEDGKEIYDFLAENLKKLPQELVLCANSFENAKFLLDTAVLSRYKFHKYKSDEKKHTLSLLVGDRKEKQYFQDRIQTLENILLVRDLGETPTSDLTPKIFANIVQNTKFKHTKIKVFGPKEIEKMGMGLLHAVGSGSDHKPYFVILERIVDKKYPTIGFVGKGIVFDTGGLNIKMPSPIGGMEVMKFDMCGAAAVYGVMKELDRKDLKVNIIAAMPIAENAIGGNAYRPSDILTSYSGKTVQITNTDAEGRLILADALSYISKNYKLDRVISLATLTGLCVLTFGHRYAAVMGDDADMMHRLVEYGKSHFEKYWELPFDKHYLDKTKSDIADFDNHSSGAFAGTIMGGGFIYNFRMNNEKFTHIDIASVANIFKGPYGLYPQGVTGFGVDSLSEIFLGLK